VFTVTFFHVRGVYHHDIKMENLLMDDAGDLNVLEYGLSAITE
jgi:5'-AMP-activated protein kinase, catalytic alpha subunit